MRNYVEMKKIADEFRIAFHKMPDANKEIFVKDIALGTHALVTNFLTGLDDRVFRESVLDNLIEPKCKDSGPVVSNGNVVNFSEFKRGKK